MDVGNDIEDRKWSWWRSLRSAKAWLMLEQFQIVVLSTMIGFEFPSDMILFSLPFNWSTLSTGLAWKSKDNTTLVSPDYARELNEFSQHSTTVGANPTDVWLGTILMFFIITVILVIIRVTLHFVRKDYFHQRATYTILRFFSFSQIGLLVHACHHLVKEPAYTTWDEWLGLVLAIIILIAFGLVYPIAGFVYFNFFVDDNKLLESDHRKSFGCLNEQFKMERRWFVGVSLFKRSALAIVIGFSSANGYVGCGLAITVYVIYGALIGLFRPLMDVISFMTEIVVIVGNIAIFGFLFFFKDGVFTQVAWIYLQLAIQTTICGLLVLSYLFLWARMFGDKVFSSCGGGGE